ncbi:MAG: hypothetical protein JNK26_02530 [Candidatus Doudnabacteria bacterium]|nr:hypothetical protein [Candidatus Doudnabacteria bacterium]
MFKTLVQQIVSTETPLSQAEQAIVDQITNRLQEAGVLDQLLHLDPELENTGVTMNMPFNGNEVVVTLQIVETTIQPVKFNYTASGVPQGTEEGFRKLVQKGLEEKKLAKTIYAKLLGVEESQLPANVRTSIKLIDQTNSQQTEA